MDRQPLNAADQLTPAPDKPMHVHIVVTIPKEEAAAYYAATCATVESCMTVTRAEWKAENGVAIFEGSTTNPLSEISSTLYGNDAIKDRVRSVSYHALRK